MWRYQLVIEFVLLLILLLIVVRVDRARQRSKRGPLARDLAPKDRVRRPVADRGTDRTPEYISASDDRDQQAAAMATESEPLPTGKNRMTEHIAVNVSSDQPPLTTAEQPKELPTGKVANVVRGRVTYRLEEYVRDQKAVTVIRRIGQNGEPIGIVKRELEMSITDACHATITNRRLGGLAKSIAWTRVFSAAARAIASGR